MITTLVDAFLWSMIVYLILGFAFSIFFYLKGGALIDEGTKGTPWHFKLIIFPGVVLFWCVLFIKILKKS